MAQQDRRSTMVISLIAIATLVIAADRAGAVEPLMRIATFQVDVTPPLGHPLLAGMIAKGTEVVDPLSARGFVLLGEGKPVVFIAIDWCEIRNDAHDRWREALAEAASTDRLHVMVHSVHQHDTPLADLEAQRSLESHKITSGAIIDRDFHEKCVRRAAAALRESLAHAQPVTHIGLGSATVDRIASNRRIDNADGTFHFGRYSATGARYGDAPEGLIDPILRTISLWNGDKPLVALHSYATHPMSYYGKGGISYDFPGMARARLAGDLPGVVQIYASGCAGNVTAGKYNDGSHDNRAVLADRLYDAMKRSWASTQTQPIRSLAFRSTPLRLEPRDDGRYTHAALDKVMSDASQPFRAHSFAAMTLSWRKRADAGYKLDVPVIDFGVAQVILLPGESYVEYQLYAQKARPNSFVMALGYGECAPGYIPTDDHIKWNDENLSDWNWVALGSEARMYEAIKAALAPAP